MANNGDQLNSTIVFETATTVILLVVLVLIGVAGVAGVVVE